MKQCIKCNEIKPLKEYYKHKGMADGHLNKCKMCVRAYSKSREKEKRKNKKYREDEKRRQREKYYRLDYRDKHKPTKEQKRKAIVSHRKKYPEKYKARSVFGRALRSRKVLRPFPKAEGHHWNYNKGFEKQVIWLTRKDHNLIHRFIDYDKSTFMYKRKDTGKLLDSLMKHKRYIESVIHESEVKQDLMNQ